MFPFIHTMHVRVFYSFILDNVIKISAEKDQLNYVLDLNFQLKPLCTVNIPRLHSRSDCTTAITAELKSSIILINCLIKILKQLSQVMQLDSCEVQLTIDCVAFRWAVEEVYEDIEMLCNTCSTLTHFIQMLFLVYFSLDSFVVYPMYFGNSSVLCLLHGYIHSIQCTIALMTKLLLHDWQLR